ncbi:hypothetical protein VD0002_g1193 [Verticillium dahliae]|nr:hypothetical protein VD0003_g2390 [Verticillium dahliae]PNH69001.1 hypothetical protein VD0002_g1193 [Verticillium dahliae]
MKPIFAKAVLLAGTIVSAIKNPILPGWNPDPAILRVDDTYYIAVSSFTYFPGVPIYRSRDLANWELVSHALQKPQQLQLNGISSGNGVWAPGFSHIDGRFYITSMTRWGDDPDNRTWPRIWWTSSEDLETWTDLVWAEPYGIDPELFRDPDSGKTYLLLMGPNNNYDRVWGITQCEVDLRSGKCTGPYFNTWNGTLPHDAKSRPEGPKMFKREGWYYLLLAEGGTSTGHRATIGRSKSPEGPWEAAPNNPLIYNGADQALTIQSTGHATFTETPGGAWFASLLARRNVKGASPLGREAFLVNVTWADGWPTMNGGRYLVPSQFTEGDVVRKPWVDNFEGAKLDLSWYQVRTPYAENYRLLGDAGNSTSGKMTGGLVLNPNVFTLSDRDVPAAIFHKQTSLNMTFSATLLPTAGVLGPRQQVGISAYLSDVSHQDIGVRGCWNATGLCVYTDMLPKSAGPSTRPVSTEWALNTTSIPSDLVLHIDASPLVYYLGYARGSSETTWLKQFETRQMANGQGYSVFEGAMFALFASGAGEPWPFDAPDVGFGSVGEVFRQENIPDFDDWSG